MRLTAATRTVGMALAAVTLAATTAGASVPPVSGVDPAGSADVAAITATPAALPSVPARVLDAPAAPRPPDVPQSPGVPQPPELVREVGSWYSHGYTLDLRPDGTGELAAWTGAFDGTRIPLRLIPAPGEATVAEVTAVETVGAGSLGPDRAPGVGGLVTVSFGDVPVGVDPAGREVDTAHVEWTSGADRQSVDLCPTEGLDAAAMTALGCGA